MDELGGGCSEVRGLEVLVVLHDGHPVGHGGVVGGRRGLTVTEAVDGAGRGHDDAETWRAADGLLAGGQHNVDVPGIECNLLAADGADTVDNNEGVGADAADELSDALDVAEDTSGGVNVGDGEELVGLLLEGLLDLLERGAVSDGSLKLGGVGAIGFQASSE